MWNQDSSLRNKIWKTAFHWLVLLLPNPLTHFCRASDFRHTVTQRCPQRLERRTNCSQPGVTRADLTRDPGDLNPGRAWMLVHFHSTNYRHPPRHTPHPKLCNQVPPIRPRAHFLPSKLKAPPTPPASLVSRTSARKPLSACHLVMKFDHLFQFIRSISNNGRGSDFLAVAGALLPYKLISCQEKDGTKNPNMPSRSDASSLLSSPFHPFISEYCFQLL